MRPMDARTPPRSRAWLLSAAIYGSFVLFMLWWFRVYFTSEPLPAVDLPGHMGGIWGIRDNLSTFGYVYYDISTFTGYPAFAYYAWVIHLVAALLSVPLTWVATDPVQLASHLVLVAAMVLLPLPIPWSLKPALRQLFDSDTRAMDQAMPVVWAASCAFSFWYINHDNQWYGLGAAAVMNIGLFSQAYGWHVLVLVFGALLRLLEEGRQRNVRLLGLVFALLLLVHTMTAVFAFFLVFMSFCWYHERRALLVKSMVLAGLLAAFWLVPLGAYLSSFAGQDIHRPKGDFLEMLLRYPLFTYWRTLKTWMHGQGTLVSAVEPTFWVLLLTMAVHRFSHKARLLLTFMLFEALGLLVLNNDFVATSVPMGFHYYRFQAYLMLFMVVLLAAVPAYYVRAAQLPGRPAWLPGAVSGVVMGALLVGVVTQGLLPHNERSKVAALNNKEYLKDEYAVLDYFRNQPAKGRVLFEYFSDYGKYPFLSCHFMSTRLLRLTGFESINGLFVQSSLAYHFPMGAANGLKANTYNGPLMYPAVQDLDDDDRMRQLKEFGITHVVVGGDEFLKKVKPFAMGEPVVVGKYKILKIADPPPLVTQVNKTLVAYTDVGGKMPFKYVELYFWAKKKLEPNFEVLHARPSDSLPPQVAWILVNGPKDKAQKTAQRMADAVVANGGARPQILTVHHVPVYLLRHFGTWYQHNPEIDDFTDAARYLDAQDVQGKLTPSPQPAEASAAQMRFAPGNQRFRVSGMEPGKLYRVNYSFVPFFFSLDAPIWRITGDRIMVWAKQPEATITFSRLASGAQWWGLLLTAAALLWWRKDRKVHP